MKKTVILFITVAIMATALTACGESSGETASKEKSTVSLIVSEEVSDDTADDESSADAESSADDESTADAESTADDESSAETESKVNDGPYRVECEKATAYVNSLMNTDNMTQFGNDKSDESNHFWNIKTETAYNDLPMDVTVLDQKISVGTTLFKELREAGFRFNTDQETVEANEKEDVYAVGESGGRIEVYVVNTSDKAVKLDDLPILELYSRNGEDGLPYNFNGISEGSDLKAILDAFGTPNDDLSINASDTGTFIYINYKHNEGSTNDHVSFILQYDSEKDTAALYNFGIKRTIE